MYQNVILKSGNCSDFFLQNMVIENTKNNFFTLSKKGHQLTNTSPTLVSSFNLGHHIIWKLP